MTERYDDVKLWAASMESVTGVSRTELECEELKSLVNRLIDTLYEPSPEGFRVRQRTLALLGMNEDVVNWGDIGAVDVEKHGDLFIVTLAEAGEAKGLIAWLERWLRCWGWNVIFQTTC